MKRLWMLSLGVLGLLTLQAQKAFSLEDAVAFALENNKQLNATRYDIEKSESAYREARAGWLPQVDGAVDFMTYFDYEINFMSGGDMMTSTQMINGIGETNDAIDLINSSGAFGAAVMPNYTSADAMRYMSDQIFSGSLSEPIIMGDQLTAKVQVGQVLFNGQILSGIRMAKIGMAMAEKSIEQSELDVRANVANTYYSALTLEKTLATIDSSLVEMEDLVTKTDVAVRAGVLEETELDQLRIQLSNLKNTKLAMKRNVQINYNLLRFHLGLNVNEAIVLTDSIDLIMELITEERALTQTFDVSNNINYQMLETNVEMSKEQVDMEKMAYAPTLSAFYVYNAKLMTSGFDMNPNNTAGASLSVPIFSSGMRKNKVDQKRIELLQAEADKEVLKENLFLQESQLRYDYMSKFEQYQNQKANVAVARRVFESYERKFRAGTASGMDLTQANSSYLQAESDYLSAMLSLLQARVSFFKLLNTL